MTLELEQIEQLELTQFINVVKDYIRIYAQENKLFASYEIEQKIKGKMEKIRCYAETQIPITVHVGDKSNNPKIIHCHWSASDTLKTLLALKPEKLNIEYWGNNQSQYMEERCINRESVFITGIKGSKKYRIEISDIYSSQLAKMADPF
jgi:hypothetical protein